jgi:AcrR family transcriptional regulator
MPRKAQTKKTAARKSEAKKPDVAGHILETAMRLAAEAGWRDLSLAAIADAAKLPLAKVYPVYPSKQAILNGLFRQIDVRVLEAEEPAAREGSARDRLFDVLMRRFDALVPYRPAIARIVGDQARDPLAALCGLAGLARSMACMLEAAGLSTTGIRGALRVKALSATYLGTLRVWLSDESPDLAATMAALDRHLARLESLAGFCSRLRKRSPESA